VVTHRGGPLREFLEGNGIEASSMPVDALTGERAGLHRTLGTAARILPGLRAFLRREQVDIVHVNDARIALSWLPAAKISRVPMLWHQRSRFPEHRTMRWAVGRADRVVCISHFVSASLPSGVQGTVVPNPFDTREPEAARGALLEELGVERAFVIGAFGRIVAFKKLDALIDVLADVAKEIPDAHLCLFGRDVEGLGPALEQRAVKLGVEDRLHLMGFRDDPSPWMAACDVICAPAIDEGAGRVVVEAMLARVPVVAVDSGGHRELVTHEVDGMLVPPGDVAAMARTVTRIAAEPGLRAGLVERARQRAEAFSVEAHVAAITTIYDGIV
jgi:glycosyltransferase involved in cell wall biosynthesis